MIHPALVSSAWLWVLFSAQVFLVGQCSGFQLRILHDNDVHARFTQFNARGQPCTTKDIEDNQCYGGAARRSAAVKQARAVDPELLYLCAGDQFQGTLWYTVKKWVPIAAVMNAIQYTAMSFGNHEFDDGLKGLAPFLRNVTFPVLGTNVDGSGTSIAGLYNKATIVTVDGEKIGLLGYVTPETAFISNPGTEIRFEPEIEALKRGVKDFQDSGINKIVAVGHSGIGMDQKICKQVPGIDVVVGGHTNTFLYTGEQPAQEIPQFSYPIPIDQEESGSKCLVVTDYAYGKYLGNLSVTFDQQGEVTNWAGNPILLDQSVAEDPSIATLLNPFRKELEIFTKTVAGHSASALDGYRVTCRLKECNLGNLLADIVVDHYVNLTWKDASKRGHWTDVSISVLNGGGIRDFASVPGSAITEENILAIFPFGNTIDRVTVNGSALFQMFEHSVAGYSVVDAAGRFLQVSGIRVTYDLSRPDYNRVLELQALCARCDIPKFEPVALDKTYTIASSSYLIHGGDGYSMLKQGHSHSVEELLDFDLISSYLKSHPLVYAVLENRIKFETGTKNDARPTGILDGTMRTFILILSIFTSVVGSR